MKKHLISVLLCIVYSVLLIKVMVFKDVPAIKIGVVMFDFAGTNGNNPPNFIPFKTILPYVLGEKGLLIGGLNLLGNIVFLIPIGLLLPFLYRNLTWKKSLMTAIVSSLLIEIMQVILRVGIFDIDDVILNALGVMIGNWISIVFLEWLRSKRYSAIIVTVGIVTFVVTALATLFIGDVLQQGQSSERFKPSISSDQTDTVTNQAVETLDDHDLCGGTGGNGEIVSIENNSFILKINEDKNQTISLTPGAEIHTSTGLASVSDLKTGDKVTLVGGPNPDGSFTAEAVFVCSDSEL